MSKKFELTSETKIKFGIKFFRIKALISFGHVKKDELGGWVEKEENLSQYGNAWVSGNASVSGYARVYGDAEVYDNAEVYGYAWVYGDAEVCDNARVYGDARVSGDAEITRKRIQNSNSVN